ncbi:MAG: lysylphosphatidylglycerol synthase transmembrane domain-containing protein [Candidatus Thorarchaeota archaeon]
MKKYFLLVIKIIISIILLAYLFSIIPVTEVVSSIKSAEIYLVLIGFILAAPISYLSALETQYLTKIQGMSLSVFEILKIHLVTSFYGLFLPGTLSGGAVKWYKFSKYGNKFSAAAVVVFNRFLEVLIILLIGIIFSIPALFVANEEKLIFLLVLVFILLVVIYFALLNRKIINTTKRIIFIIPLPGYLKGKVENFTDAMLQFQKMNLKDHLEILGLLFFYHGLGVLSFFCFAISVNIDLSIWIIGWIRSAMSIALMLPVSFAGLGIREGSLVFLFSKYGVLPDVAMALSLLFFSRNLLASLIGGVIEFKEIILSKRLGVKR